MEIKVGALVAGSFGSLVGLTITRPTSYSETFMALVTGAASAYYLGEDVSKIIHFNIPATSFIIGTLGFAAVKLLNSFFIKISADPLAAVDRIVGGWFSRLSKQST